MIFNINAALLDALVLAIVKKEDTYGYEITRVLKFMTKSIPDETGVITR